jgi:hypothetical protein
MVLKMVVQLSRIGKGVGRGLNDRNRKGVAKLRPRLATVHGQGAEAWALSIAR